MKPHRTLRCWTRRLRGAFAGIAAFTLGSSAQAIEYNLAAAGSTSQAVSGDFGGTAIFSDHVLQPTGTGVFDPFLTLDANGQTSTGTRKIESAYNSETPNLYLDQHRTAWNTYLKVNELASINLSGVNYFGFVLDANEPGGDKELISIDNIRIYTSASDTTASVANDITKLNNLGTLRWAMNNPLSTGISPPDLNGFNVNQWVKLDASQENVYQPANGGSGKGDMFVYIPQAAFGNSVGTNDYLWFYNLNGVHYSVDSGLASQCGFEEWRAVKGPQQVPDNGSTVALLGLALTGLACFARRLNAAAGAR